MLDDGKIDPRRIEEEETRTGSTRRSSAADLGGQREDMVDAVDHSLHGEHGDEDDSFDSGARPVTPSADRVQFIVGEKVGDEARESHPFFAEMEELVKDGDEMEWKETARWIKFEEDVEEGGNRWSKPHVATLSLHSLFELRSLLLNGTVMLDMEASSLEQIADLVLDNLIGRSVLPAESREKVRTTILARHRHQHQCRKFKDALYRSTSRNCECSCGFQPLSTSKEKRRTTNAYVPANNVVADNESPSNQTHFSKQVSYTKGSYSLVPGQESSGGSGMDRSPSSVSISRNHSSSGLENSDTNHRGNTNFMRKIPPGAEASNILVGEVDFLNKTLSAFVRLSQAGIMGDLTEVPVPTRFIFVLLGPTGGISEFHEIGRAMATLMSDEVFRDVAYKARNRSHLLAGIDEFLNATTVLPPGLWDPATRIEPPTVIPSQELRRRPKKGKEAEVDVDAEEKADFEQREASGLTRSGKLFGGLVNDVRRKAPWYVSDFKDALALQTVASFFYIYFACLSPIITFGGLLSEATDKNMAAMESLVSGCVCGIFYGFFAGQPLTILASTGPVLVLETIVFELCKSVGWNYMSFRFWTGTWITFTLMILVAIDASAYVCYITRFTEEIFAALIALVFVYKAIENVLLIGEKFPINVDGSFDRLDCRCIPSNETFSRNETTPSSYDTVNWTSLNNSDVCHFFNGTLVGAGCNAPVCMPNVFLMSVILFSGTFLLCVYLKQFRNAPFFPSKVREIVSDFAVIMAIFAMSLLDYHVGMTTPKLEVPQEFKPTLDNRGWFIWPFQQNPWYSALVAVAPALLGTILIFMDQQITAVIVNRKENKLKKGCGYHLDLFVVAILIQICSIMGLPWFVGATVMSISHVQSLKLESECAAPGEKPQFFGVREQRVTQVLIFVMIGCSVLLTSILRHIPMPVLFGVFLYMGVASLEGLQFIDRSLITLMPAKYQPDFAYLRKVPIKRVHLFTFIQLLCLASLWILESFNETSILFPLMLAVLVGVRKLLDLCFTRRELSILDNVMPKMRKKDVEEMQHIEDGAIGKCR